MHPQTHLLLLLLQNEGRDVRFDSKNEVFYFKPAPQDGVNLENLNLLHPKSWKLTQKGIWYQPVANADFLDNSGLNTMLLKALETATKRLNNGKCKIQPRTEDAVMAFVDAYNKSLVDAYNKSLLSETYVEELPAEIQAAVDVLENEVQEEQVEQEQVVEKKRKTRKKTV